MRCFTSSANFRDEQDVSDEDILSEDVPLKIPETQLLPQHRSDICRACRDVWTQRILPTSGHTNASNKPGLPNQASMTDRRTTPTEVPGGGAIAVTWRV